MLIVYNTAIFFETDDCYNIKSKAEENFQIIKNSLNYKHLGFNIEKTNYLTLSYK